MDILKKIKADFHIHTCLSPCAELEMSPQNILLQAKKHNIDLIGICDHNSAENVEAVSQAADEFKINVLPGLEVNTVEEAHILALFDEIESALKLQELIYENLPGKNDEDIFGMQVIVNSKGEVLGFNKKLLIGASNLTINQIVDAIHSFKGLAIASHVDRESFSLINQLGFIPEDLSLDALEISPLISVKTASKNYKYHKPIITFSDAHFLKDIGSSYTTFYIKKATINEIKKAFLQKDGRRTIN